MPLRGWRGLRRMSATATSRVPSGVGLHRQERIQPSAETVFLARHGPPSLWMKSGSGWLGQRHPVSAQDFFRQRTIGQAAREEGA